eukprot:PhF_6_TR6929/c0_g1_i1/m.10119
MDPRRLQNIVGRAASKSPTKSQRKPENNTTAILEVIAQRVEDGMIPSSSSQSDVNSETWNAYELKHPIQGLRYPRQQNVFQGLTPVKSVNTAAGKYAGAMTTEGKVHKAVDPAWVERQNALRPNIFDHCCPEVAPPKTELDTKNSVLPHAPPILCGVSEGVGWDAVLLDNDPIIPAELCLW